MKAPNAGSGRHRRVTTSSHHADSFGNCQQRSSAATIIIPVRQTNDVPIPVTGIPVRTRNDRMLALSAVGSIVPRKLHYLSFSCPAQSIKRNTPKPKRRASAARPYNSPSSVSRDGRPFGRSSLRANHRPNFRKCPHSARRAVAVADMLIGQGNRIRLDPLFAFADLFANTALNNHIPRFLPDSIWWRRFERA